MAGDINAASRGGAVVEGEIEVVGAMGICCLGCIGFRSGSV